MLDISTHVAARRSQPERLILVCMIGSNQALADSCRANLDQLCPGGYHLQESESSDAPSGCDIYIWDFESSSSLPGVMLNTGKATPEQEAAITEMLAKLPTKGYVTRADLTEAWAVLDRASTATRRPPSDSAAACASISPEGTIAIGVVGA